MTWSTFSTRAGCASRHRRRGAALLAWIPAAAVAAGLLTGCGSSSGSASSSVSGASSSASGASSTSSKSSKGGLIAFVPPIDASPYYTSMTCGVKSAATKAGYQFISESPTAFTASAQEQVLTALEARHPAALLVDAVQSKQEQPFISSLVARGTKVLTVEEAMDVKGQISQVLFDNTAYGALEAKSLVHTMGTSGDVLVVNYEPGTATFQERLSGLEGYLKNYPNIHIVSVQYGEATPTTAAQVTSATLSRYPTLRGIVPLDGYESPGILSALKQANKTSQVTVVGVDRVPGEVTELQKGQLAALTLSNTYGLGVDAGQIATRYLNGQRNISATSYLPNAFGIITPKNTSQLSASKYAFHTC